MFLDDNLLRTDAFELWSEENSWVAQADETEAGNLNCVVLT